MLFWRAVGGRGTDSAPTLLSVRRRRGQVVQFRRFKGAADSLPVLMGEPSAEEESRIYKALHAAAVAKYQATHGPRPDPTAAAAAKAAMDTLSRAYLALGRTADELERVKSLSFLDRLGEGAEKIATAGLVGLGLLLGFQVLRSRPGRRMDY